MNSTVASYPHTMPLKLRPPLMVAAAGLVIAGIFAATGQWIDQQRVSALQPEISGVTIEQQPISARDPNGDLIVTSVESDGPAHNAGIQAGDKIISVDGQVVASKAALRAIVEHDALGAVHLRVQRGFESIAIDLPAARRSAKTMRST